MRRRRRQFGLPDPLIDTPELTVIELPEAEER